MRTNTITRDPIGTTAELQTKRCRQSLRAHILDNVEARTIDPQKLLGMCMKQLELITNRDQRSRLVYVEPRCSFYKLSNSLLIVVAYDIYL